MDQDKMYEDVRGKAAAALNIAKKTGWLLLKKLAATIGIPLGVVVVIALLAVATFFAVYGALPVQVKADDASQRYKEAIRRNSPPITSEDRGEEQYLLTWGLPAAIDYKLNLIESVTDDLPPFTGDEMAKRLAPVFEYRDSTKFIIETVTDEDGNERKERTEIPVKLVSRVNTFRGTYHLHYERVSFDEGDTTVVKDVLSRTDYAEDWSRLIEILNERGHEADTQTARLVYRTAEALELGAPHFSWVSEGEEEVQIFGAVGWDWSSSDYYVPEELAPHFEDAAEETGLDVGLIKAVAAVESCFNSELVSSAGAIGVMQLMPNTAKLMGVNDTFDPRENILGGAKYLKQMLDKFEKVELALAAYNAGPGNVEKHGGIPPFKETEEYVPKVMNLWRAGIPVSDARFIAPVKGPITSPFGERIHPIRGEKSFHSGIDIGVSLGTPVRAAKEGKVSFVGSAGVYGLTVILDHGNGYASTYAHNYQIKVRKGEKVTKGQVIALVGSTGVSTGPHLHFEVRVNGKPVNPINNI